MENRKEQEYHKRKRKTNREARIKECEGKGHNPNLISYPIEKYNNQAEDHNDQTGQTTLKEKETKSKYTETIKYNSVEGESANKKRQKRATNTARKHQKTKKNHSKGKGIGGNNTQDNKVEVNEGRQGKQ